MQIKFEFHYALTSETTEVIALMLKLSFPEGISGLCELW